MQDSYTHYDNLKVARNAPPEVIRAAYKILSQKYHPDRNPENPNAEKVMAIINASYEVLSNPTKRAEHDKWIAEKESKSTQQNKPNQNTQSVQASQVSASRSFNWIKWILLGLLGLFLIKGCNKPDEIPIEPKPYIANPTPENISTLTDPNAKIQDDSVNTVPVNEPITEPSTYERPLLAPNGEAWPAVAGYIKGYKKYHTNGLSSVTIDNTQNDSDVFVKLVSLEGEKTYPVRVFYIPALSNFTVKKVKSGSYDIRYQDLNNGGLFRSELFILQETKVDGGVQFSNYTMTLYKVQNGNMQTYSISEAEF